MRFFEFGNLAVSEVVLHYLEVHFAHNLLDLLVEQLSVDLGLLEGLHSFHGWVDLPVALALGFFLGEAEHLLVVSYQLVEAVSLVLVKRPVVSVVVLDLLLENSLEY